MTQTKAPLFSTYSQGENRVTSSLIAVLERIDLSLVEQLLAAASGESSLEMVRFKNQVTGTESVPDASISADFQFLFETKIKSDSVNLKQLKSHLKSFNESTSLQKLFVVTPDDSQPKQIGDVNDQRVTWFSFQALHQAIEDLLDEDGRLISERSVFLLTELRRLFEAEHLLRPDEDIVVVAAREAYDAYLEYGIYACQVGRSFRRGVQRLGFYKEKMIQIEFPLIEKVFPEDVIDTATAKKYLRSEATDEKRVGKAIKKMVDDRTVWAGTSHQIMLLSEPDSKRTLRLDNPIIHEAPNAWTQRQRYLRSSDVRKQPTTTSELGSPLT